MPPEPGITLSTERVNELRSFMKECHACERIDCKEGAHREEMRLEETELGTVPTRVTDLHLEGQLDRVRSEDVRLQPAGRWVGGVAVVVPVEPI